MKILLPIDGSFYSKNAVQSIARCSSELGHNATIILVNVVQPVLEEVSTELIDYELLGSNFTKVLLSDFYNAESIELFEKAREWLRNAKCRIEALTLVGAPAERIAETADKLDVDLIVMGSHGHSALRSMVFGSVTEGVLSRTNKPILLVRGTPIVCNDHPNIGIAIDASDYDTSIMDFIRRHRHFFGNNAQISLIHVINPNRQLHATTCMCQCQQDGEHQKQFDEVIDPMVPIMEKLGFQPKTVCLVGNAAKELIAYTSEKRLDMLIMGSHGYKRFDLGLLSSTTLKVAEAIDVPLLIVHHN